MVLSLVYDDADAELIRSASEVLDEVGWKATFFANPASVLESVSDWRALAKKGHEVGNGALVGATLSGDLLNWTARMVEQDLHMTQTFLEDTFGDRAMSAFLYPGLNSHCADGDYRSVVESIFEVPVAPTGFVLDEAENTVTMTPLFEWGARDGWVVAAAPHPRSFAMEELRYEVKSKGYRVLPFYQAAHDLGRIIKTG